LAADLRPGSNVPSCRHPPTRHRLPRGLPALLGLLLAWPAADAAPGAPARTGTIEGRLDLPAAAPRRAAERYVGAAAEAPRTVQPLPAIVYLQGAGGSGAAATATRMVQRDTVFQPGVIVVPVGATVAFPNDDPFFHNVFSYSPARRFDLGRYPKGESKSVRFDRPGVVRIYCEVHRTMRAAVVVVENPHFAIVEEDGAFTLRDVPPGRHELAVWHPDRSGRTVTVSVEAGRVARVAIALR
jgi:plastocyanin